MKWKLGTGAQTKFFINGGTASTKFEIPTAGSVFTEITDNVDSPITIRLGYKEQSWFDANPGFILKRGQAIFLHETGQYKIGDGETPLVGLTFSAQGGGSGSVEIDHTQIAFGTGTGITSSSNLVFDGDVFNLNSQQSVIQAGATDFSKSWLYLDDLEASNGFNGTYLRLTQDNFTLYRDYKEVLTTFGDFNIFGNLTGSSFGINRNNDNAIFNSVNGKGIEYNTDYSSTYTNRSLVDKQYVDSKSSSIEIPSTRIVYGNAGSNGVTASSTFVTDGTKMSIGANITNGYNGSFGLYNARSSSNGLDRIFVGENFNYGQPTLELRSLGSVQTTQGTGRFLVYAGDGTTISYPGSSINLRTGVTRIDSTIGTYSNALRGDAPVLTSGTPIFNLVGQLATNYGTRLDANGLRIGQLSTLHTSNPANYQISIDGGIRVQSGAIYSNDTTSFCALNSNLATIGAFNTRSNYVNGIITHRINNVDKMVITSTLSTIDNTIIMTSLTGSGTRMVVASPTGQLSTSSLKITDPISISRITDIANWDLTGVYIGPTLSNVNEGERYRDNNYIYEMYSNTEVLRTNRV